MTEDVYNGINSKDARKFPSQLQIIACRKLDMINSAQTINDLRSPPGNRLEALKGDMQGKFSIRINSQYRIVFLINGNTVEAVQITDYHP